MRWRFPFLVLAALSGCETERRSATAPPATTTSSAPAAVAGPPVRIMPLGDSITQGDSYHDTYRRPLWKTLRSEGYDVDFVGSLNTNYGGPPPHSDFDLDHEGHWGWRVDQILAPLRSWLEAAEPDFLLVHLGSNDLFQRQDLESTLDELRRLIEITGEVRPEATILLAQILPTTIEAVNDRIARLNARITALAGPRVIIVDAFTGFDPERMTYDGVHPSPDGEIHLSDVWLESLLRLLAPATETR